MQNPTFGLIFQTEKEFRYFRNFQKELAVEEPLGSLESSLWGYTILRSCHGEPFVLDAVIAISALSVSKGSLIGFGEDSNITEHAQFAFKKYERALQVMRKSLAQQISNPRMTLIACLLVCSFETLAGHHFNALIHAKSGIQILRDWMQKHPPFISDGIASPDAFNIEDVLIQVFVRLDAQILTSFDSRPIEVHDTLKTQGDAAIERMPSSFYSLDEAHQYLSLM